MKRKLKKVYYADTETTQPHKDYGVRVYLWAIVGNGEVYTGESVESLIRKMKKLKGIFYFHNLKFDFSYIHYYLLQNDIKCNILEKNGVIYSAKFFNVELRDSMNFLQMSLAEVGKNYCKIYQKTSIDYNVDYWHKASEEEKEYCINDCKVLEEGLTNYFETLKNVLISAGATYSAECMPYKLTNSGIAFEAFKELSDFDTLCPKTTISEYRLFRKAYNGGYVFSRPSGVVKDVNMFDVNSMYPYVYSEKPLPFGNGKTCRSFEEAEKYNFYICEIDIMYTLKDGYIPIIGGGINKLGKALYKAFSDDIETLCVSNIDLKLIKRFYNCEIAFKWAVGFETKPYFFKKHADTFMAVKQNEKGAKRNVAKVLLNSPYGKTAMNGLHELKNYYIGADGTIKNEIVGYQLSEESYQYLPIAIAITAYAREMLLTSAESIGFENIQYMDTDSIKFTGEIPKNLNIDDKKLGFWKNEGKAKFFKTLAPKKYMTYTDGEIDVKCAGFNKKILENELKCGQKVDEKTALKLFDKFEVGLTLDCLQSKKLQGGRGLLNVTKEIK